MQKKRHLHARSPGPSDKKTVADPVSFVVPTSSFDQTDRAIKPAAGLGIEPNIIEAYVSEQPPLFSNIKLVTLSIENLHSISSSEPPHR